MPYFGKRKRLSARTAPIVRSGHIWHLDRDARFDIVAEVCGELRARYGVDRLGNPLEPLDDLIFIILSNKTRPETTANVFASLKSRYPAWDDVLTSDSSMVACVLRPAGLAMVKAQQIVDLLRRLASDFGRCTLDPVVTQTQDSAQAYLVSLPGVSEKVAKCVMMYTMGMEVLPVDAHMHRIALRLGWTARKRADQCHAELEALVPPAHRYAFHVDCVVHGRVLCRQTRPLCDACPIRRHCLFDREQNRTSCAR